MVADIVQRVKDLEQFSYIVSHNLRAPVANIRGLAEILQMPGIEENEAGQLIAELGGCVKKLDDVIHDLNYILQIRDKEDMHNETVRFSGLLNDITDNMATQLRNEDAVISADFSEVEEMQTVRSFMHSIFLNIISNSVKYHRPGVPPHISISTHRIEGRLQIRFRDNGLGIDLEKRGHQVFGLYKRFHGHVQGKGMGLFMVKTQVESLGGQIKIDSKVDDGTELIIELEAVN
jgi:signal transduction histidine kinase